MQTDCKPEVKVRNFLDDLKYFLRSIFSFTIIDPLYLVRKNIAVISWGTTTYIIVLLNGLFQATSRYDVGPYTFLRYEFVWLIPAVFTLIYAQNKWKAFLWILPGGLVNFNLLFLLLIIMLFGGM